MSRTACTERQCLYKGALYLALPCLALPYLALPYLTLPYLTFTLQRGLQRVTYSFPQSQSNLESNNM